MQLKLNEKKWRLVFLPPSQMPPDEKGDPSFGQCQGPHIKGKKITINNSLSGELLLETLLHEMLHAFFWEVDEEIVHRFGEDVARVLWRLGYRLESENGKDN